jgi:hypothetical protein
VRKASRTCSADRERGLAGPGGLRLEPIDLASWAKEREATLVAEEDALSRAARDHATNLKERAFWDAVIVARERNRAPAAGQDAEPAM